ncbi:MAG: class I SAM-dependent methyltransferase [Candidatus Nanohaloarchaea archaeon]
MSEEDLEVVEDLFGKKSLRYYKTGNDSDLKLELDNERTMSDFPVSYYVDHDKLRDLEKEFLEYAKGKILDVGAGSGRICKIMEEKGHEAIGVEKSAGMVEIMRDRGFKVYQIDVNKELPDEQFDTAIMYGNGFGMPGKIENIESLLERLKEVMSEDAIIIAESNDYRKMKKDLDKEYQERNRELGRYEGQRVWRHRVGNRVSPYFKWVQVSVPDMKKIAEKTGWEILEKPVYEEDSQWGAYFFALRAG